MFAMLVLLLPSAATGGAVRLQHGLYSITHCTQAVDLTAVHALAWYADTNHELAPLASGHRLALVYSLVHTSPTPAPRPSLFSDEGALDGVAAVLNEWGAHARGAPEKLVYLLEEEYPKAGLTVAKLNGADAHAASVLSLLAPRLEFCLGLAHLEHEVCGQAVDERERRREEREEQREMREERRLESGYYRDYPMDMFQDQDSDDEEIDEKDLEFDNGYALEIEDKFTDLVGFDVTPIVESFAVGNHETIPADLNEVFRDIWDEQQDR
jgi:hypothetical protein